MYVLLQPETLTTCLTQSVAGPSSVVLLDMPLSVDLPVRYENVNSGVYVINPLGVHHSSQNNTIAEKVSCWVK